MCQIAGTWVLKKRGIWYRYIESRSLSMILLAIQFFFPRWFFFTTGKIPSAWKWILMVSTPFVLNYITLKWKVFSRTWAFHERCSKNNKYGIQCWAIEPFFTVLWKKCNIGAEVVFKNPVFPNNFVKQVWRRSFMPKSTCSIFFIYIKSHVSSWRQSFDDDCFPKKTSHFLQNPDFIDIPGSTLKLFL